MDHGHLGFGLAVSGGDADRTGLANVPALRHDAAQDLVHCSAAHADGGDMWHFSTMRPSTSSR